MKAQKILPHDWECGDILLGSYFSFSKKYKNRRTTWTVIYTSRNYVVIQNIKTLNTRRLKVLFNKSTNSFFAHYRNNFLGKTRPTRIPDFFLPLFPAFNTKPPKCPSSASSSPVVEAFSRLSLSRPSAASPANPPNQKA